MTSEKNLKNNCNAINLYNYITKLSTTGKIYLCIVGNISLLCEA